MARECGDSDRENGSPVELLKICSLCACEGERESECV